VPEFRGRIYDSITDTVGATPLVRLDRLAAAHGSVARLAGKLEFFNPIASVKDRLGLALIEAAEQEGRLQPGSVLIEATSGNTGIGLAFAAAAKGYPLILCMPESMSVERRKMLALLGARVELTPAATRMGGAIARAEEIQAQTPGSVILRQFDNPANPAIHRGTTAEELWHDSHGAIDFLVAGVGTGGTITGAGKALKQYKPTLQVVAVEPAESAVLSGGKPGEHKIQGIGSAHLSKVLDRSVIDEVFAIPGDDAIATARQVARLEGVPVGISAGAALLAGLRIGRRPENAGKLIVVVVPDFAERYLSTELFDDA
jgi:cysteine synthase A